MAGWGFCRRCRGRIWWGTSPYNADKAFPFDDENENESHFDSCAATEWVTDQNGDRQRVGACKACGAKVWWQTTRNGKRRPMDVEDGQASWECHFDTCEGERVQPEPEPVGSRARTTTAEPPPPTKPHKYSKRAPGGQDDWLRDLELWVPFTKADVQTAFRRLAMKYHPDMGGEAWDFIRIKWAYDHLKEAARV